MGEGSFDASPPPATNRPHHFALDHNRRVFEKADRIANVSGNVNGVMDNPPEARRRRNEARARSRHGRPGVAGPGQAAASVSSQTVQRTNGQPSLPDGMGPLSNGADMRRHRRVRRRARESFIKCKRQIQGLTRRARSGGSRRRGRAPLLGEKGRGNAHGSGIVGHRGRPPRPHQPGGINPHPAETAKVAKTPAE